MNNKRFAMDTFFWNDVQRYPLDVRCEMLKELGFDGTYLSLSKPEDWDDLPQLGETARKNELDVAAVWAAAEVSTPPDEPNGSRLMEVFDLAGEGVDLELAVLDGSALEPDGHRDRLARWLDPLLDKAEANDSTISLYPHVSFALETTQQAVEICKQYDHPRLKLVFCGFHWYVADQQPLAECIRAAGPWLHSVNLSGASRGGDILGFSLLSLDAGQMDNFRVLGALNAVGYTGRIGLQGYNLEGDCYDHLRRGLNHLDAMLDRVTRHPHWAAPAE